MPVRLDIALNLHQCDQETEEPVLRWAWLYASTIKKAQNMLSTKISTLPVKDIVAIARAANNLSTDCARMEDGGFEDAERLLVDRKLLMSNARQA